MTRQTTLEAFLLAVGFVIGVACTDSNAQAKERTRSAADDSVAITRLLSVVRGGDPLICEMATRAADTRGSWSMWGPLSGDPLVMDSASSALLNWIQHRHDDPAVVPKLRAALQDNDSCVRRIAGSLLSRVRHPSATAALMAGLDDAKAGTREASAFGLGMAEQTSAVDPLIKRLEDPSGAVRRASAWALGQLEAKKAVPALVALVTRDQDPRVRQTAAWAIGSIH
jgi:HEAT repeat protein